MCIRDRSLTEADPLCSHLAKKKDIYGVSSEDMDILTFGSPISFCLPYEG